jgi:hypothetical protein
MSTASVPPLDPPPRKAQLRRAIRNMLRAYRTVFALVILVFAGWAALDALRWHDLNADARFLTISFAVAALFTFLVWVVVEKPFGRELRLARRGVVAQGQIVTIGKPRGRRALVRITYAFRTATGATIEGACKLPRRYPTHLLEPGGDLVVLYDSRKPHIHKPWIALDFIEFGAASKRKASGG